MRIEENKIFEFKFPFHGGELSIPVRAHTLEEAGQSLRRHLNDFMVELATEFPLTAPATVGLPAPTSGAVADIPMPSTIPSYALELDIENLVKELMPIMKPKGTQTIPMMVKAWTKFEYSPENFLAIIDALKSIKRL